MGHTGRNTHWMYFWLCTFPLFPILGESDMKLDVSVSCVRNIKRYLTLEWRMQNYSQNNIKKQPQEEARNKREMTAKPRGDYCFVSRTSSVLLCKTAGTGSEVPQGLYCRSVKWKINVFCVFFSSISSLVQSRKMGILKLVSFRRFCKNFLPAEDYWQVWVVWGFCGWKVCKTVDLSHNGRWV